MATTHENSIDFDLALPDFSILDKEFAEIDASFAADLPALDFDFAELDRILGLGDLPDFPLDLPAIRSRDPGQVPEKRAHARYGVRWRGRDETKTGLRRENKEGHAMPSPRQRQGRPLQTSRRHEHRAEDA